MSGFAGVFHLDGAPVDRGWLEAMGDSLSFRGPDGKQIWISGSAGLCQTHLRVRPETDGHPLIQSLDGFSWIAGDVRVDDRESLIATLPSTTHDLRSACSAELMLHAYNVWGEACVEHLLGDFSLVIWDSRRKRVFAARDRLGIKLLYYAIVGRCLLISNTVDCLRQIPIVPRELNERAIGDFLLVGMNRYPDATFFSAIRRLPVAHRLTAGAEGPRTERYWTLPVEEPVFYRRTGDYVDRLHELLGTAVRDRLPAGRLGVFMSGGLDSPFLAATAVRLGIPTCAFTSVYDRLIPDKERHFAGLAAKYIGIPVYFNVRDDEPWGWGATPVQRPEPFVDPLSLVALEKYFQELPNRGRVFFLGDGPDDSLRYEWQPYLKHLVRRRRWGRLCLDLARDFRAYPRLPFFPVLLRSRRERRNPDYQAETFPPWFNHDFETRLRLRERWAEIRDMPVYPHPVRPVGYSSFASDFPMGGMEGWDEGFTRAPLEFLHPFWDIRLLRFFLAVPAVPWCRGKYLIRMALRGRVPEEVRLRPKAPLAGLPYVERVRRHGYPDLVSAPGLKRFVIGIPKEYGQTQEEIEARLRILGLQYWLHSLSY